MRGDEGSLRALIVDDSAFNRRTIGQILESSAGITVVGKASDGDEALKLAVDLQPDVITLDLEMPRMDGFTFLRLLMARRPTPVIVVSGYANKENVFRALELGALDFVAKPTRSVTTDLAAIGNELLEKVRLVRHLSRLKPPSREPTLRFTAKRPAAIPNRPSKIVLLAASTGGPTALVEVFRQIPATCDATILVAQHMPPRFTQTFAERLDRLGGPRVRQAEDHHPLKRGEAWICPGGKCMEVGADGQLVVVSPRSEDRYVPSADRLFETAAKRLGDRCVAAVLTGMGDDGAEGAAKVKQYGGLVMAEAAETAVIYGMPQAATRAGAVDESWPITALAERLGALIK
ncbi:MAG: chemotaxis-specific protein-glutamate methyltransferase CheB [Myxococcota bacterium]